MLVKRYNFETNSSSMHSLSFRRESGPYTEEELKHSEAMCGSYFSDAIITLKEGKNLTPDEVRKETWIYSYHGKLRIHGYDMDLANSAMQVMSSFESKLTYALATNCGYGYKGREKRIQDIKDVFAKYLPGITLEANTESDEWGRGAKGTNQYLLYPFLKKNKISIEEFLTNTKYIVIVNYPEFEKMKWLGMVDENQIADVFRTTEDDVPEMKFEDGVWKLAAYDISFGRYPFRVLGTPEGKARYALAAYPGRKDEILNIMQEIYPELKDIQYPKYIYGDNGELDYGYCEDCAIPGDVSLRDFILDKRYVIISDGDEYCVWSDFKNTPLFNQSEYLEEEIRRD